MKGALLVGLFATSSAFAGVDDFARVRVVLPVDDKIVQRLVMPQDVYEWVTRDDLGDVRVLNGAGEELAYALRRPAQRTEPAPWQTIPLFVLPPDAPASTEVGGVNIELGAGGTVIAVHGAIVPESTPRHLLDASGFEQAIAELELEWPKEIAPFVAELKIEGSDNLSDWTHLVYRAALASLTADGNAVTLDRIALPTARARYLRLTQTSGATPLAFTRASVRSGEVGTWHRASKTLHGSSIDGGTEFDTEGHFPVDELHIERDSGNFLVELELFSRRTAKAPWQGHGTKSFYRVAVDGTVAESEPARVTATTDRHWRVVPARGKPADDLRLRIAWIPDEIVFVRDTNPPFTLAYGRGGQEPTQWPMSALMARLHPGAKIDTLPLASLSESTEAGGEARLVAVSPTDWQTVLLWSVLVLGVASIATLAYRLARI